MAERDFRRIGRFQAVDEVDLVSRDGSRERAAGFAYAGSLGHKMLFPETLSDSLSRSPRRSQGVFWSREVVKEIGNRRLRGLQWS
jgi:hypothetical protein